MSKEIHEAIPDSVVPFSKSVGTCMVEGAEQGVPGLLLWSHLPKPLSPFLKDKRAW